MYKDVMEMPTTGTFAAIWTRGDEIIARGYKWKNGILYAYETNYTLHTTPRIFTERENIVYVIRSEN